MALEMTVALRASGGVIGPRRNGYVGADPHDGLPMKFPTLLRNNYGPVEQAEGRRIVYKLEAFGPSFRPKYLQFATSSASQTHESLN